MIAVLYFVAFPLGTLAQWVHTNGPFGGAANSLVPSGDSLLSSVDGTVYLSTDGGASWNSAGLPYQMINSLVVGGGDLFALTGDVGILLSSDGGRHWEAINNGLPSHIVNALVMTTTDLLASVVNDVVLGPEYGVYRSTDNGASWTSANSGLTDTAVNTLALSAITGGDTIVLAGTSSGVFSSTDCGRTWLAIGLSNVSINALTAIPSGGGTRIVLAGTHSGVFRSTDGGVSWNTANTGLANMFISAFATGSDDSGRTIIYLGTAGGGIYRSIDDGTTWINSSDGLIEGTWGSGPSVSAITVLGSRIFACTSAGIYLSTDNGNHWTVSNKGLPAVAVHAFLALPTGAATADLLAGTFPTGIFRSTDYGAHWTAVNDGITGIDVLALAAKGDEIFAGVSSGVFCSTNAGLNWKPAGLVNPGEVVSLLAVPGENRDTEIIAGTWAGNFVSRDNGATWDSIRLSPLIDAIAFDSTGDGRTNIFAGTRGSGLFVSSDYGTTWTSLHNGIPVIANIDHLAFGGSDLFAADSYVLYKSTDNGMSWAPTGLNTASISSNTWIYSLAFGPDAAGSSLFVGTSDHGVMVSSDHGLTWNPANTGLTDMCVYSLAVAGPYLFAGTNIDGVWRRPLSELTSVQVSTPSQVPSQFLLSQNYPNPFNPSTTIRYALSQRVHVTLSVFNTLGQKIATLVDELQAPGEHSVRFDGSGLGSGVYYYRLQAGGYLKALKMLNMR